VIECFGYVHIPDDLSRHDEQNRPQHRSRSNETESNHQDQQYNERHKLHLPLGAARAQPYQNWQFGIAFAQRKVSIARFPLWDATSILPYPTGGALGLPTRPIQETTKARRARRAESILAKASCVFASFVTSWFASIPSAIISDAYRSVNSGKGVYHVCGGSHVP